MSCFCCKGSGKVVTKDGDGANIIARPCPVCDGTGKAMKKNKEWLDCLSRDTKAYWLAKACAQAAHAHVKGETKMESVDFWREWLDKEADEEEFRGMRI